MAAPERQAGGREGRLWAGFLLPPTAWALSLGIGYALVSVHCALAWTTVITVVALVAAGVGTVLAFREYRRLEPEEERSPDRMPLEAVPYDYRTGRHARQRLMSKVGWVVGILMIVSTAAHGVALVILGCR